MKGGKRTLVVEVPVAEMRVAILEGILGLTKPKNQSAAEALQAFEAMSPAVAEMAERAANNAMALVARCAAKAGTVQ
jgi:hypothetical protein